MNVSVIAYNNLKLSPYDLTNLLELKIVKKINDHAKLYFTGIVPENEKDSYIEMTKAKSQIEVSQTVDGAGITTLFKGIIENIKIKAVRDIYYIEACAISNTYNMDVKLKSRSFQNKGMSYTALVKEVVSDYSGGDVIDTASNGKSIKKFTMQYNETDWEFLKRMASRFNAGLVPDAASNKPKFWFGTPQGIGKEKLDDFNYSISKRISDFRVSSENTVKGISENDFIYYEVETDKPLSVGYEVDFKGKSLYVYEAVTLMKNSTLKHQYILAQKKGLSQNTLYNDKISGLSIQGKVIEVTKDEVKVHLEIDDSQSVSDAWNFKYSTTYSSEGSTGWYCMPEIGDNVIVYFPDNKEENGVSVSSVRKSNEDSKLSNPEIKYFRTKSGKELKFSQDEIVITAKDGDIFIKLNEKDGIEIFSKKEIKVISKNDITIDSERKVTISSKEEISLSCKESSIKMDGEITLNGKQVKVN